MKIALTVLLVSTAAFADSKFELENGALKTPAIVYTKNKPTPEASADAAVQHVADYLNDKTYISLMRIEAHVPAKTPNALDLTKKRALEIAKLVIAKGIDCKRLIAVGFGDSKPVSETAAENERIVFVNAELKGRAIGGMPVDGSGMVAGELCKAPAAK